MAYLIIITRLISCQKVPRIKEFERSSKDFPGEDPGPPPRSGPHQLYRAVFGPATGILSYCKIQTVHHVSRVLSIGKLFQKQAILIKRKNHTLMCRPEYMSNIPCTHLFLKLQMNWRMFPHNMTCPRWCSFDFAACN